MQRHQPMRAAERRHRDTASTTAPNLSKPNRPRGPSKLIDGIVIPRDRGAPASGARQRGGCELRGTSRRRSRRRPGEGPGRGSRAQPREGSPRAASRRRHGWFGVWTGSKTLPSLPSLGFPCLRIDAGFRLCGLGL